MKTLLLVTAAATAFIAAPAMAQSTGPVGSAGITWSNVEADAGGASAEDGAGLIDANVAGDFGSWTVSLDAGMSWADGDLDEDRPVTVQAHLTRKVGDLRVGGFIGQSSIAGEEVTTLGVEAQKYMGQLTVSGAASYSRITEDANVVNVNGDVAYFVQDNLRLNVGAGFGDVDSDFGAVEYYSYGAGAEYLIPSTPLSVYAAYDRTTVDDFDLDVDTFSLGLRFTYGAKTLRAREESGADLGRTVADLGVLSGF